MALVFFACWIVWALQEVGAVGFLKELFAPKGESAGLMKVLMIVVFFAAGWLEIISILFRPVSLSFRLYGNIFAGKTCWKPCPEWSQVSAGSCRFRFISWNCWWVLCRPWSSCCCALSSLC